MNNPTEQIRQITRKLFKAKSGSVYIKVLHPKRDWIIGLGVGFCIILGITAWNGYTYFANRDGGSTDAEIVITNPRYQADVIDQALNIFTTKSNDFSTIDSSSTSAPLPEIIEPIVETETATSTPVTSPELDTEEAFVEEEIETEVTDEEGLVPELSQ